MGFRRKPPDFELPARRARPLRRGERAAWLLLSSILVSRVAASEGDGPQAPLLWDDMNAARPMLQVETSDQVRLLAQQILPAGGSRESPAERVLLATPEGASAPVGYPVPPAPVIEELRFEAVIRCSQPGAQLAARVTLPRSIDPSTGRPRRILVRCGELATAGAWQRLRLEELPRLTQQTVRVVRAQQQGDVDDRGAQVEQLVILAPGGRDAVELLVDEIAVYGVLRSSPGGAAPSVDAVVRTNWTGAAQAPTAPLPAAPRMPRLVEWRGEPLSWLRNLGFHGVWLDDPPTEDLLGHAEAAGMWLVCRPPAGTLPPRSDRRWRNVWAWHAQACDEQSLAALLELRTALTRSEAGTPRPLAVATSPRLRAALQAADILLTQTPSSYGNFTPSWPGAADLPATSAGVPAWAAVAADAGRWKRRQLAALSAGAAETGDAAADWDRNLAAALATAPQGIVVRSTSSLAATDAASRIRVLKLALTNRLLTMLEPWLATGTRPASAETTRSDYVAQIYKTERSQLAWIRRAGPVAGSATSAAAWSVVVPGAPETSKAYDASLLGLEPVESRRVAGGLEVVLRSDAPQQWLLVTDDAAAVTQVERYLRLGAADALRTVAELAALERQQAAASLVDLPAHWFDRRRAASVLTAVDGRLAQLAAASRRGELPSALRHAVEARHELQALADEVRGEAAHRRAVALAELPVDWSTIRAVVRCANALEDAELGDAPWQDWPAGRLERLDAILAAGWTRSAPHAADSPQEVSLSHRAPGEGAACLQLDTTSAATVTTGSPAWVRTPPLPIPDGTIVEVAAVVRVGGGGAAGTQGAATLSVTDSYSDPGGGRSFGGGPTWQRLRLARVGTGAPLQLTFALEGPGVAWLDAIQYRFVPTGERGQGANVAGQMLHQGQTVR